MSDLAKMRVVRKLAFGASGLSLARARPRRISKVSLYVACHAVCYWHCLATTQVYVQRFVGHWADAHRVFERQARKLASGRERQVRHSFKQLL